MLVMGFPVLLVLLLLLLLRLVASEYLALEFLNLTLEFGWHESLTFVNISIYDLMGRMIKSLSNANQTAGYHSLQWDATNNIGESVSAGMYIYTIQAGEYRSTKKMVLLK